MALKTTAQQIKERWGIEAEPGADPFDVLFGILSLIDDKIETIRNRDCSRTLPDDIGPDEPRYEIVAIATSKPRPKAKPKAKPKHKPKLTRWHAPRTATFVAWTEITGDEILACGKGAVAEMTALSKTMLKAPGCESRRYSRTTLRRWYMAAKARASSSSRKKKPGRPSKPHPPKPTSEAVGHPTRLADSVQDFERADHKSIGCPAYNNCLDYSLAKKWINGFSCRACRGPGKKQAAKGGGHG